jgi:translation initiation factor 3 subunit H
MPKPNFDAPVEVVQLDGQVMLRIIKHANDNDPYQCSGALLGLPSNGRLEVTNCIPTKAREVDYKSDEYNKRMQECLGRVNSDVNNVGWFNVSPLNSFFNKDMVERQFEYQSAIPSAVCLLMEPYRPNSGRLQFKAFRLSNQFMTMFESGDLARFSVVRPIHVSSCAKLA